MAICIECVYCNALARARCNNSELPITNFIYGVRHCDTINIKGDCKGFKPIPKSWSIYESKADEELASTDQDDND